LLTGVKYKRPSSWSRRRYVDVVERGWVRCVRCAFDSDGVAGFKRDVLDDMARGVVAVRSLRGQFAVGRPSRICNWRLTVDG
jgi:hypothetical protein